MKNFKDKVIIITGASSGIGKALAQEAAKQGANVVLAARRVDNIENLASELSEKYQKCIAVKTDVEVKEDCQYLVKKSIEVFGKINILVNNAGISMRALFNEMDISVFEKLMNTNLMGTVYCSKYALPYILKEKGSIVGVSSIAGVAPLPARTAYSASKFAMFGFLTTLRLENIKNGLHVMIVHPGFTESEVRLHALTASGSEQGKTPRNEEKMMTSQEVAVRILKGILKRKRVQVMSFEGNFTYFLYKFFPKLIDKLIYSSISKEPDTPLPK